jgi:hypothetical protein
MSGDFHNPDWDNYNPYGWEEEVAHLWDDVTVGDGWEHDSYGKMLFETAYVERDVSPDVRAAAREMLESWFEDRYGYAFDEQFDWDDWREWYETV